MSRPTAPELLEAASRELRRIRDDNLRIDKPDFHTMTGAIEELERRLSLAQTEIKGHMRVEDELRAELLVVQPKAQVMHDLHDALGVKWGCDPYAEIRRLKRFEKFCEELLAQNTAAQARIAELEKELAELHREWEADILAATDLRQDAARYRFIRNLLAIEDVERLIADGNPTPDEQESLRTDDAIDLALKSRA